MKIKVFRWLLIFLALLFSAPARAQQQGTTTKIRSSATFPTKCTPGTATTAADVVVVTGELYICGPLPDQWIAAVSGLPASPTYPIGVPQFLISTPGAGGIAEPLAFGLPGIGARTVVGVTNSDTILPTDCSTRVVYQGTVAVATALPTATGLGVPACIFRIDNNSTNIVTVTPSSGWPLREGTVSGLTSVAIVPNQQATFYVNSAANGWDVDIFTNGARTCLIDNESDAALTNSQIIGHCSIPFTATIVEIDVWGGTGQGAGEMFTGASSVNVVRVRPSDGSTATILSGALATPNSGSMNMACALASTSAACINGLTSSGSVTITTPSLNAGDTLRLSGATADGTQNFVEVAITWVNAL